MSHCETKTDFLLVFSVLWVFFIFYWGHRVFYFLVEFQKRRTNLLENIKISLLRPNFFYSELV